MKRKPQAILLTTFSLIFISMLIFAGSDNNQHQVPPAYALPHQAQATPPRNILVNLESTCDAGSSEHIRFGNESSHYYQFLGKKEQWYKVKTTIFSTDATSISIDTKLLVYRRNPAEHHNEQPIAVNDDKANPDSTSTVDIYASELNFKAVEDGQYWIEVQNLVSDGRGSYCLQVLQIAEGDATKPEQSEVTGPLPDECEFNNTIDTACEIEIRASVTDGSLNVADDAKPFPEQDPTFETGSYLYNFVPTGGQYPDLDFYKLWVKKDQTYICQTYNLSLGNDTNLIFFNGSGGDFEPNLGNDDIAPGNKASKLSVRPNYNGWLYILVNPHVEIDPARADQYTYRLACVNEITAPNEQEKDEQPDNCEVNDSFDLASACQVLLTPQGSIDAGNFRIIGTIDAQPVAGDQEKPLNFAPWSSGIRDVDYFKLWSKARWRYSCKTQHLVNGNDTKMTFFYYDTRTMTPGDNPNDDYRPDDLGSEVEVGVGDTRTGWLIIKVEPVMDYIFEDGGKYQYQLQCEAFPPPGASLDSLNSPGVDGVATRSPDDIQQPAAPNPESGVAAAGTVVPSGKTAVSFVPIAAPAPTPVAALGQPASFTVQLYYDKNDNAIKEADEGVANVPIYIYNGLSDRPMETTTTAGGAVFVKTETAQGKIQVIVPYFNISQEIDAASAQDIRLRISSR